MPKRHRVRARARRPLEATAPQIDRGPARAGTPAPVRDRPERMRPRYRGAPPAPGSAYAVGAASATLERAAAIERGFVMKDFRRLGLVAGVILALLVGSGFAVSLLVR